MVSITFKTGYTQQHTNKVLDSQTQMNTYVYTMYVHTCIKGQNPATFKFTVNGKKSAVKTLFKY